MLCLLLLLLISIWTEIHREISENVVSIPIINHGVQNSQSRLIGLKAKHVDLKHDTHGDHAQGRKTYTSQELRNIGNDCLLNPKLRTVPDYDTLRNIKTLKINKRRIRFQKWTKMHRRSILMNNITKLPRDPDSPVLTSKNLIFATVNTRSLKSSINQVLDLLVRENIDILLVTETWLKPADELWLKAQGLLDLGYKYSAYNRPGRKRGGENYAYL